MHRGEKKMPEKVENTVYVVVCEWKTQGYYLIKTSEGLQRAVEIAYETTDLPPHSHSEILEGEFKVIDVVQGDEKEILKNLSSADFGYLHDDNGEG